MEKTAVAISGNDLTKPKMDWLAEAKNGLGAKTQLIDLVENIY
ncbi:hypothetical protein [Vagococcus xieshaowenii]|nr:hypothetical protein [Vagococcus xieshaowenii]